MKSLNVEGTVFVLINIFFFPASWNIFGDLCMCQFDLFLNFSLNFPPSPRRFKGLWLHGRSGAGRFVHPFPTGLRSTRAVLSWVCPVPVCLRNVDDIRLVAQTPSPPPPIVPARNVMQRLQCALSGDDDDCSHIMVGRVRSGLKMN